MKSISSLSQPHLRSKKSTSLIPILGKTLRLGGIVLCPWLMFLFALFFETSVLLAAQDGDFTYTSDGSAVTITKYTGSGSIVTIPGTIAGLSVKIIGYEAFYYKNFITSVTIPNSVTTISEGAFSNCLGLTSLGMPGSVTSIGKNAFYQCASLTSISIPYGVASVGEQAFIACHSLVNVTIPASVTSIGRAAFGANGSLIDIQVATANRAYRSVGGVLFNADQTILIQYPGGRSGSYSIPGGVSTIGDPAFYDCAGLTSVSIPQTVVSIQQNAFYFCSALTTVKIPGNVVSIGAAAFWGCSDLTSAIFTGNAPVSFGSSVFTNAAPSFSIYYYQNSTGFTSPTWMGYPSTNLGFPPAPEIVIEQPAGSNFVSGATSAYGTVTLGNTADLVFTVKNTGNADLILTHSPKATIAGSSDFTVTAQPTSPITGPSGSTTFTVRFAPTSGGAKTVSLFIPNNDTDENTFVVNLTGTGITAAELYNTAASSSSLSGPNVLPNSVPFGDGVENLLKYAFNMNLSGPDSTTLIAGIGTSGLPAIQLTESGPATMIRVEFLRRKGGGLTYAAKRSSTLVPGSFVPMSGTPVMTSINNNWERVVIQESADPAILPHLFARVEVVLP